jgi:hypothetical protein
VTNFVTNDWLRVSIEYGQRLHSIVEAGWRVMGMGYRKSHNMSYVEADLQQAISDYDSRYQVKGMISTVNCQRACLFALTN